jgi:hypothetical protein
MFVRPLDRSRGNIRKMRGLGLKSRVSVGSAALRRDLIERDSSSRQCLP